MTRTERFAAAGCSAACGGIVLSLFTTSGLAGALVLLGILVTLVSSHRLGREGRER